MGEVKLTRTATRDLENIRFYTIREWGATQADRYLSSMRQKLELLAAHPRMAPALNPSSAIRAATHREHRIFYTVRPGGIEVARVFHQAQDFTRTIDRLTAQRKSLRERTPDRMRDREPEEPEP